MNQVEQPTATPVAYCRACGKPVFQATPEQIAQGLVFCEQHAPAAARPPVMAFRPVNEPPSPYTAPVTPAGASEVHPVLAFILGVIPGVGAVYNGQYAKGLIHAVVFASIVTAISASDAGSSALFLGILLATWVFYMAFEAYHTAKRRQSGVPVDEFSSLVSRGGRSSVVGPLVLIGLGALILLSNLGVLEFRVLVRYWPVSLILLGAYLLYSRLREPEPVIPVEVKHD